MKSSRLALFDTSAVFLSGLCLIHCLALPLLASLLPLFASWNDAEWVHPVFVAIAAPLAGFVLWRSHRVQRLPSLLWMIAAAGLLGLLLGALHWPSPAAETPMTVAGSLLLALAHIWNARHRHLRHHHHRAHCTCQRGAALEAEAE